MLDLDQSEISNVCVGQSEISINCVDQSEMSNDCEDQSVISNILYNMTWLTMGDLQNGWHWFCPAPPQYSQDPIFFCCCCKYQPIRDQYSSVSSNQMWVFTCEDWSMTPSTVIFWSVSVCLICLNITAELDNPLLLTLLCSDSLDNNIIDDNLKW